jgi:hypothetical protein
MRKRLPLILLAIFFINSLIGAAEKDEKSPITTATFFEEMTDLARLANFPSPAFHTVQYSSFDRCSKIPGGPGWFANSDGFGDEPIPNFEKVLKEPAGDGSGEYLIADVQGPGSIVRLWSAAISGKIQLFLDNKLTPLYDGPAIDFFHQVYNSFPEVNNLNKDLLKKTIYQADAAYAPIPFKESMRLVWIGNLKEIHFYHVGLRLYELGTEVISFSPQDLATYSKPINRVINVLSDPDRNFLPHSPEPPLTISASIAPSEKKEILSLKGPAALEILAIKLKAQNMEKALRQTLLHIVCDDYPWGQVQSPLGDFFGAAPGINPFDSLPFTVRPDGTMVCRYVMPFKTSLKITIDNYGDEPVQIEGSALPLPFKWDDERSMHFRARWRVDHNLIAANESVQDLPFLIAHGKGVYVGTTSYVLNPCPVPTSRGNWWGEGDEKIFIDKDQIPSTFGTGSEDYYNYSWSAADIFYSPYCGQPRNDGPGNRGFVTNFRWHILDCLPFEDWIQFYMELFSHERTPGLSYARIGYHYGRPGLTDDHKAIMPDDLRHLELPPNWQPAARGAAWNSEFYEAEEILKDGNNTRLREGRLWAGGKILIWKPQKTREGKTFAIKINETGKKQIHLTLAMTPNSGKVTALLDNKPVLWDDNRESIDLYEPYRTMLRTYSLPHLDFEAGEHALRLEYAGTSSEVQTPEIGIDFIWVQKIEN